MRRIALVVVAAFAAAVSAPHISAQVVGPATLQVKGNVEQPLTVTLEDLRRLPVQRMEDVRLVRDASIAGGAPELVRRYTGCLLRDVLERAKPVEKQRMDLRKSAVVVTAADGYRVVFSWAEVFLSPIGEGALVVYERDGKPLPDNEGPLALVSLKDTRPGPRHVKWLSSVELRLLAD
jgi:DMSO/TMAO reductase YedYZ molybdopterin-dependent catalytic subunit